MTTLAAFDKHDSIKYQDAARPYWGRYPFKLVVKYPPPKTGKFWDKENIENRATFHRFVMETCGDIEQDWRSIRGSDCVNLFFNDAATAATVIDRLREHIALVQRPRDERAQEAMRRDHHAVVRESLFWGRYRWCLIFHRAVDAYLDELDDWVTSMFVAEPAENRDGYAPDTRGFERFFYSYAETRRLYLNHESDVLLVKMAIGNRILRIEKVILKKELDDAYYPEQATD